MTAEVRYRDFWGAKKWQEVRDSLDAKAAELEASYTLLAPSKANAFVLRAGEAPKDYEAWATPPALCAAEPISGLQEMRRGSLFATDRVALEARMARYLDPRVPWEQVKREGVGPVWEAGAFEPNSARRRAIENETRGSFTTRRYALQPFDDQWAAWTPTPPLWNRPRPELARHIDGRNRLFVTRMRAERPHEYAPAYMTRHLPDYHLLRPNVVAIPAVLLPGSGVGNLDLLSAADSGTARPNLSPAALRWTAALGLPPDADTSRIVWHHALAVTYSPAYLAENAAGVRQGWPRVPLPNDAGLLRASAALGARLALLLDADTPAPGVTAGAVEPALAAIAVPTTRAGAERDWRLANWGNRSDAGVTMPGRGQAAARDYAADEAETAARAGLLGARTLDVGMNGASFWKNVPEGVWEARIGGYQALKKWLSYRDGSILDRALAQEEVAHVRDTARRLAAILLMGPDLDAGFRACAAAHAPLV